MGLYLLPDGNGQVFGRTHFALHKRHIQVQVLMIQLFYNMLINNLAQLFYIEHKTRIVAGLAFDCDIQLVIMTMPVGISAFAKNGFVLCCVPVGVIKFMGGVKMLNTGQIHHLFTENLRKDKGYARRQGTRRHKGISNSALCLYAFGLYAYLCHMYILLTAATHFEIQPAIHFLAERDGRFGDHQFETLITGIGSMSTAYWVTKAIATRKPDYMIQAGVAGSFSPQYPPGSLVMVSEEICGDLGVEENNGFKDVFDMGLPQITTPFSGKGLVNIYTKQFQQYGLPGVKAITINEISTRAHRIQQLQQKYAPDVESMEGAAFHYVGLMEKIPFLQVRAVSNTVGERDKTKWKMKEAIEALNNKLIEIIRSDW
jgi:futalosine nucleosidase